MRLQGWYQEVRESKTNPYFFEDVILKMEKGRLESRLNVLSLGIRPVRFPFQGLYPFRSKFPVVKVGCLDQA